MDIPRLLTRAVDLSRLLTRAQKRQLKTFSMLAVVCWLMIYMVVGRRVHVGHKESDLHVGFGSTHSDTREVHIGVGTRSNEWRERLRGPLDSSDDRLIQVLRNEHLHPPSNKPYHLGDYKQKLNYKDMDSWKWLHERILKIFSKRPAGFFVEAGALDGEYLSNTLHLEKVYGWKGLLVEANPSSFKELVKKNRKAWSSNTCLAVTPYPKEMVLEMMDTHEMTQTYQAKWAVRGGSFLQEAGRKNQEYQAGRFDRTFSLVQCFPLVSYLHALNVTKVDLFSLDVEGAEEAILDTIPWTKVQISVLLLEHHGSNSQKDQEFVDSMTDRGYTLYDHHIDKDYIGDYIFVQNGFFKT